VAADASPLAPILIGGLLLLAIVVGGRLLLRRRTAPEAAGPAAVRLPGGAREGPREGAPDGNPIDDNGRPTDPPGP
jgi:hypothetical protein